MGGKSDGGLMVEGQPFRLLEIKSVGLNTLRFEAPELYERYENNETIDKIWMDIGRPFPSHMRQGLLYLYMAIRGSNADVPVPTQIVFIYEWKPRQLVKRSSSSPTPRWSSAHAGRGAEGDRCLGGGTASYQAFMGTRRAGQDLSFRASTVTYAGN